MADEQSPGEPDSAPHAKGNGGGKKPPIPYSSAPSSRGAGYFTIYKKGQGYWTRVCSVAGAIVIGAFTAYNLYVYVPTFLSFSHEASVKIGAITAGVFVIAYAVLCWWLLNKSTNVDFLIATDSEMKKVNWTSRKELVGSTQIVIIFMFFVAMFLFSVDWIFGTLMWLSKVLSVPPWGV